MEKGIRLTELILTMIINNKTAAGLDSAEVAREALAAVKDLQKAFDKVCTDAADSYCPHEYDDLYKCEKCDKCIHVKCVESPLIGEPESAHWDIDCWKQYYLIEARKDV